MRIEEEIKLITQMFYLDLNTLKVVKIQTSRTYRFKYSNNEWSGIPIMAANMDGVGELTIAEKLNHYGMITCLTKHDVKKLNKIKI